MENYIDIYGKFLDKLVRVRLIDGYCFASKLCKFSSDGESAFFVNSKGAIFRHRIETIQQIREITPLYHREV